jgi:hypothetical protein
MNKRTAQRVAKYHATNPACKPYRAGWSEIPPHVWRGHFEHDAENLTGKSRAPVEGEIERIVDFLLVSS